MHPARLCRCYQERILRCHILGLRHTDGAVCKDVELQNKGRSTERIVNPQVGTNGMFNFGEAYFHNQRGA